MLNKVILEGRLVADPELKQTPSGVSVATFRVAIDRNYQDKSSGQRQADFISCVAWRQTGEFITNYFQKGEMILIEGNLQSRSYEDKNRAKRTIVEVIVEHAFFCGAKNQQGAQNNGNRPQPSRPNSQPAPRQAAGYNQPAGQPVSTGSFDDYFDDFSGLEDPPF